jgi:hypothetical protein
LRTWLHRVGDRERMAAMTTLNSTEKREALEEVLQSLAFVRADQLRSFLRYICEMEIAGRGGELCETLIGVEAFGRPADFAPSEDASVRRRAVDLREKLQEVYATEVAGAKIRIELPKGRYIPKFVRAGSENGREAATDAIVTVKPLSAEHAQPIETDAIATQVDAHRLDVSHPDVAAALRRRTVFGFAAGWIVGAVMMATGLLDFHWVRSSGAEAPAHAVTAPAAVPTPTVVRPVEAGPGVTYEAEAPGNTFGGRTYSQPCQGCSGGARVRHIGNGPSNYLFLNNIIVARTANYEMVICYVLDGTRSFFIKVNNNAPIEVALTGKSWLEVAKISITVPLKAGSNTIKFYNDTGYAPDLDRVVIR